MTDLRLAWRHATGQFRHQTRLCGLVVLSGVVAASVLALFVIALVLALEP